MISAFHLVTHPSLRRSCCSYMAMLITDRTFTSSSANLLAPVSPNGGKTRPRRSMSSDSYAVDAPRELTAGQKKAAEDKKGSRHADVIDTWDPTGLGSASK